MLDYDKLHWQALKRLCIERGLNIENVTGATGYIKLLRENDMNTETTPVIPLVMNITPDSLQGVGISEEGIRLDKLKVDLNTLRVNAPTRTVDGLMIMRERKFNDGRYGYTIDTHENTIHFMGGTLGLRCETLSQPDRLILRIAQNYLAANTVAGRDMMKEQIA